jgi:methylenetetrahydrofolate dehydrogenase (NADP+)/methenyltetrahydrofolate cyclohydrolase
MNDTTTPASNLIDGKAFAAKLRSQVADKVAALKAKHGITPGLAVVRVGEDPASEIYVRNKAKQTREAGMNSYEHVLDAATSEPDLLSLVEQLNADPAVHGILVQLPLPEQISADAIITAIDPAKDVDGFHVVNTGLLSIGQEGMVPCTPLGCLMMLKDRLGELKASPWRSCCCASTAR